MGEGSKEQDLKMTAKGGEDKKRGKIKMVHDHSLGKYCRNSGVYIL